MILDGHFIFYLLSQIDFIFFILNQFVVILNSLLKHLEI